MNKAKALLTFLVTLLLTAGFMTGPAAYAAPAAPDQSTPVAAQSGSCWGSVYSFPSDPSSVTGTAQCDFGGTHDMLVCLHENGSNVGCSGYKYWTGTGAAYATAYNSCTYDGVARAFRVYVYAENYLMAWTERTRYYNCS